MTPPHPSTHTLDLKGGPLKYRIKWNGFLLKFKKVLFLHQYQSGARSSLDSWRRREALGQERLWARERRADALAARQGFNLIRRGFAKLD